MKTTMGEDVERLVRLETKLDVVLDNQAAFRSSFEKHDERLKHLEQTRSRFIGFSAAIGALVTMALGSFKHLINPN
jgi:hypothetical protein